MRHLIKLLAIRRKIILVLILLVTVLLFLETRIDTIFYNIKSVFETRIGNATDCYVKIADIDGGIIRSIILRDVTLHPKSTDVFFDNVFAKRLSIDARLPDLIFKKEKFFERIYILGADLYIRKTQQKEQASRKNSPFKLPYDVLVYLKDARVFFGSGRPPLITNLAANLKLSNEDIVFKNLKADFLTLKFFGSGKFYQNSYKPYLVAKLKFQPTNIWDLLSNPSFDKLKLLTLILKSEGQPIKSLSLNVKGPLGKPYFNGSIVIFDKLNVHFAGNMFFDEKNVYVDNFSILNKFAISSLFDNLNKSADIQIFPRQGKIQAKCSFEEFPNFLITARISHINLRDFDISINQVWIKGKFNSSSDGAIEGLDMDVTTLGWAVNSRPFFDIEASLQLKEDLLDIIYIKVGDNYFWNGTFKLSKPNFLDLYCSIKDADMKELMLLLADVQQESAFRGLASGSLNFKGYPPNIETKGHLEIKDGQIQDVKFDTMNVNLQGQGPILYVFDSRLNRQEGFLVLEGDVDIRKIGNPKFCENLTVYSDRRTIIWSGWDITKDYLGSQLKMGKDVGKDFRVSFKTYMNDEISTKEDDKDQEVELEYKMRDKGSSLKMRLKTDEEFLGLEKKYKF